MAYQLSLDSCTKACSAALINIENPQEQHVWFEILERGHAEILATKVQMLMMQAKVTASEISQIAVTIGPGTFTGARIALAFARMFALARDIPLIGVSSLEAIAFNALKNFSIAGETKIYSAIDARRGQVYFAGYNALGDEILKPQAMEVAQAAALLSGDDYLLGTGRDLIVADIKQPLKIQNFENQLNFPNAGIFGISLLARPGRKAPLSPLYLRAADAKLPASHPITFIQ